ncbi:Cytochrome c oxidase assembly protein cox15 [Recurvomyces mirabilis]|uniref:Cytochrome c oxidase assembly protein cox15 n=1 Tax=Recurvomyces mirabilis TaxID=574656 RepID=A0AAE0WLQ5_9PEZI|nr:Cytochrome c oxidase assembly protein cox15 [Recurvomyces mirabilis]KAK5152059.1 Cytochrome c oxidase assembly protein cox15 [Recurvomyces mirabilis]
MATVIGMSPLRARLGIRAQQILQDSFVCRRCIHQQHKTITKRQYQQPILRKFSTPPRRTQTRPQTSTAAPSPLSALGQTISHSNTSSTTSSWPKLSDKSVAYWLLGSAASVFGIVIFGGLTRLTESGLSITEWRPVTGSFPPRNESIWEEEFARYKRSPEFKMLNSRMNLEEFKQIYWMEWGHRLWGRVVGLTFLVPTAYFMIRRRVSPHMARRLVGICGLIGFQGLIGWWMVKSGLKDDLLETGSHPRVSQYRLATHLGTAFVAYLAMLWNGLQILREHKLVKDPEAGMKLLSTLQRPELTFLRRYVGALTGLIFLTALSGALVAGLDAGLVYNNFPWMGQGLLPPKREMLDPFYSHTPDHGDLIWRNMLENPVLAQLDHRILATSTFTAVMALWGYSRFSPTVRTLLPKSGRAGVLGLVHLVSIQVTLGITTLWYLVPTPLASAHQAGALALLTGAFVLASRVFVPRRTVRLVRDALMKSATYRKGAQVARRGPDAMMRARLAQTS